MLEQALHYVGMGLAVFPLMPGSKIPLRGTQGVKGATLDQDQIRRWWSEHPEANIGLACGKASGVVGIDLDYNHGATEADLARFPRTVTIRSRRGFHLYYKYPSEGAKNKTIIKGPTDGEAAAYLRSDGYYFVAAPSVVCREKGSVDGKIVWVELDPFEYKPHGDAGGGLGFGEVEPAELPAFCREAPAKAPVSTAVVQGNRHGMFKDTAAAMRARNCSPDEIIVELLKRNQKDCRPPKPLAEALPEIESIVRWAIQNVPVTITETPRASTKIGKPLESDIVEELVQKYQADMIVQGANDLFKYYDGYWHLYDEPEIRNLKDEIASAFGPGHTSKTVESIFKMFVIRLPGAPLDMFEPRPFHANFKNGTLEISQSDDGNFTSKFRKHQREDYLTHILPFDFDPEGYVVGGKFDTFVKALFKGDPDENGKLQAYRQLFGAALCPVFPKLFFLHGAPLAGKSTTCILLSRLIDKKNIASVEPCDMKGFNMEALAGKLVNLVTDVDSRFQIPDGIIKRIEDRVPVFIQRKNKRNINAPIPSLHIFGANVLPKTFEGHTGAHDRRWIFIEFKNAQALKGYRLNYGNLIFKADPQSVIAFAIKGLAELLEAGGHYMNPVSSVERMKEWSLETNTFGLFLKDIEAGDAEVNIGRSAYSLTFVDSERVKTSLLYDIFSAWLKRTGRGYSKLTRTIFANNMKLAGFQPAPRDGTYYYPRIRVSVTPFQNDSDLPF